jgi:hypothetical protein
MTVLLLFVRVSVFFPGGLFSFVLLGARLLRSFHSCEHIARLMPGLPACLPLWPALARMGRTPHAPPLGFAFVITCRRFTAVQFLGFLLWS